MQFDFSMNFAKSRSTERLLNRFAKRMAGRGEVCDLGCGPGHIARYLRDAFGLDVSPKMLEQAWTAKGAYP
jgi:trans-aconitate methyltransferase